MKITKIKYLVFGVTIIFFSGCATHLGPKTVPRDRFDYNTAISDSWKAQTLLNIVKIRYADMPIFVEVASIVSGYSLEGKVDLGGQLSSSDAVQGNIFSLGTGAKYTDRPTITYAPITGSQFNSNFMTPIPPKAILFLMQSGWRADLILPLTVEVINGHRSEITAGSNQRVGDKNYYRVVELMSEIQKSGAIGMRIQKDKSTDDVTAFMYIQKKNVTTEILDSVSELTDILGLQPGLQELKLTYGLVPKNDQEITFLTRSMLNIMIELATKVDVPAEHVTEGRTVPNLKHYQDQLITIHNSTEKPDNAFTAVKYKDHWFWIDDRDFNSKRTFAFVMILLSLTETSGREGLPVVTIPTS
jgi:hypothetical protein